MSWSRWASTVFTLISRTPAISLVFFPSAIIWRISRCREVSSSIGLDSPPDVVSLQEAIVKLIGTGLGASIALGLVVEGAARMARDWQLIGVRVLGSWTAASALLAIAVRFAR